MHFDLLLSIALCCLLTPLGTFGFNIDIENADVFDGPRDRTSQSKYFGYSVALHSAGNNYWRVLVGAPLSNVSSAVDPSDTLVRYGAVYKCTSSPSKSCTIIPIDSMPVTQGRHGNTPMNMEEKNGMWLGGTVYSTGENGKALACAPRYIFRGLPSDFTNTHLALLWGKCHLLNSYLTGATRDLNPCENEGKNNEQYGYCEAGMSAAYSVDKKDVIVGAVGSRLSKGVLLLYNVQDKKLLFSTVDQLGIYEYMGYSVSSGHFTDLIETEYVGGAPRADGVRGKVIIYSYGDPLLVKVTLPQPKDLPTGSYFGSTVCAVDLDNNKYTDILVGAPYFTTVKDEGRVYIYLSNGQGALNLQDSFLEGDRKVNAHFGHAIASVGDLNGDGYNDVAIGAPMEDDTGAVYIYHGSSKGIELKYSQKILGSKVKPGLKMFGISVSGGVDVDQNGYPDIAVGAYGSENAVLMRSRSVVNVKGEITLSTQQITLEGNGSTCDLDGAKFNCVNITVAFSYDDVKAATNTKDLKIEYTVDLDKDKGQNALRRMFFWDAVKKQRIFTLGKNTTIPTRKTSHRLQPQTVYIMDKDDIGDVTSLLTFDLSVSLPRCGGLCPVLNSYEPSTFKKEIPFRKKCRNEVACVPDLAVTMDLVISPDSGNNKELRIGVVKDFTVQLTVENKAVDYAYTTKIKLEHPETLDFIGPDKGIECDKSTPDNGTVTVTCDVANPLKGNSNKEFGIKFKPGTVRENFVLAVEALSQDKDAQDQDNTAKLSVSVKFEADVEITGSSKQDQVGYQGPVRSKEEVRKDLESIGPEVIQTVSVRNKGPSAVDGSVVKVSFPSLYSSSDKDSFLLYLLQVDLQGSAGSCNVKVNPLNIKERNVTSPENNTRSRKRRDTEEEEGNMLVGCRQASCQSFDCSLGLLKMDDKVEIKMTFRLWENTLLKEFDPPKAVDLETSAKVKVPDEFTQPDTDNDETTIITTAYPANTKAQEKKTPWWVIFLAVLGGVLLLGGAVAVLYKLGFFKRKRIKDISGPDTTEMTAQ